MNKNEALVTLFSQLVVADKQIDDREQVVMKEILNSQGIDITEYEQIIMDIYVDAETQLIAEDAINLFKMHDKEYQSLLLELCIKLALADQYMDANERKLIDLCMKEWKLNKDLYDKLLFKVENEPIQLLKETANKTRSFIVKKVLKVKHKDNIIQHLERFTPEKVKKELQKFNPSQILGDISYFDDLKYIETIELCKEIAKEDLQYVKPILLESIHILAQNSNNLKAILDRNVASSKYNQEIDVEGTFQHLQHGLNEVLNEKRHELEVTLENKERAMNYFTISFLGKSKAGKSTLHSVITGTGEEAIGVGKQRTTRYNRVYNWENLRLIDTPGMGAPGGETDEAIAQAIIEESDIICYLVKNDSIQEKEFEFLKSIKDKNKPLIILLNVKENLLNETRFKLFLEDPEKNFTRTDSKSLTGHINRIQQYLQQYYGNKEFKIIPVQLLAASMANKREYEPYKQILMQSSHIEDFLQVIRKSVIEEGPIRRSQTLLDGSIYSLLETQKFINENIQQLSNVIEELMKSKQQNARFMSQTQEKYKHILEKVVKTKFNDLNSIAHNFAINHYNCSEDEIKKKWEQCIKDRNFEKNLKAAVELTMQEFKEEIEQQMNEVFQDLALSLTSTNFNYSGGKVFKSDFKKNFIEYGFIALNLAALIIPFGALARVLIIGAPIVYNLFSTEESKKQKINEAIKQLTGLLQENIAHQETHTKLEFRIQFRKIAEKFSKDIERYFEELIRYIKSVVEELAKLEKNLDDQIYKLNKAYAYRILNAVSDYPMSHKLEQDSIDQIIQDVKREFGVSFEVTAITKLSEQTERYISAILQENVKF